MTPRQRFVSLFALAVVSVPFLPMYVVRTVMREYSRDGESLSHVWSLTTLPDALDQASPVGIAGNVGIALAATAALAVLGVRLWNRVHPLPEAPGDQPRSEPS